MDKDKEMLEKARKLLEAYEKQKPDVDVQSMSREEIESVAGGNYPEVYNINGCVLTRSDINEQVNSILQSYGTDFAINFLLYLLHEGAKDTKFDDAKIEACFRQNGMGDAFWYKLDREGFTGF